MKYLTRILDKRIEAELDDFDIRRRNRLTENRVQSIQNIILVISLALCIFHVYTTATYPLQPMSQRTFHLGLILILVFLYDSIDQKKSWKRFTDYFMIAISTIGCTYILLHWEEFSSRIVQLTNWDLLSGIVVIVCVLIATYKLVGLWMTAIAGILILYSFFAEYLSGALYAPWISVSRFVGYTALGTEGVFGACIGASASEIFMFILYATCLAQFGAGGFFIELTNSIVGQLRGGSAKVAVIASCLFGSISGNATANVATTGVLTIPMMKKSGIRAEFAGAVESAASAGGALMPPIMGAVAFVMADYLNVPYAFVCIAALVPILLYYIGIFVMVDLEAIKSGIVQYEKKNLPKTSMVLKKGWYYILSPLSVVVMLIVYDWSAGKSALVGTLVLLVTHIGKKLLMHQKLDIKAIFNVCTQTAKSMLIISVTSACAGIILATFMVTGLSWRLSSILIELSHGHLIILLILTMIASIILSMGRPISTSYMMIALLLAPAIIKLGVLPIAAHMFILYFGIMSSVTPPIGITYYVASGIAGSRPVKTGFQAWRLTLPGYILPFVFAYNPALLLQGNPLECLQVIVSSLIGVIALAYSLSGYCRRYLGIVERILFGICAVLSIIPEIYTDVIGLCLFVGLFLYENIKRKANRL